MHADKEATERLAEEAQRDKEAMTALHALAGMRWASARSPAPAESHCRSPHASASSNARMRISGPHRCPWPTHQMSSYGRDEVYLRYLDAYDRQLDKSWQRVLYGVRVATRCVLEKAAA